MGYRQIDKFVQKVIDFSNDKKHSRLFQSCGLYLVGSSLYKPEPNDIDITLVGLDFRAVFDYTEAHLKDPEALIEEGIFIPSEYLNVNPEYKIVYKGKKFQFCRRPYDNFSAFDYIQASKFSNSLFEYLAKEHGGKKESLHDSDANPFLRYQTVRGDFLGSKSRFGSIDFIIHGENLLVPFWKKHQEEGGLPFVTLHEWKNSGINNLSARRLPRQIGFPDYIDPCGQDRSTLVRSDLSDS